MIDVQSRMTAKVTAALLVVALGLFGLGAASQEAAADSLSAGTISAAKTSSAQVKTIEQYRLYNPNSGEHLFTSSTGERDNLRGLGWYYEGIGWYGPSTSNTPVYRLYNPNNGDHHYTTSARERDDLVPLGWIYEGVGWYSDDSKRVPIHRLFNPNAQVATHHYTTDTNEYNVLGQIGWNQEGAGWYATEKGKPFIDVQARKRALNLHEEYHAELDHGPKPAQYQKYIVLHDTEGNGGPAITLNWWLIDGKGIAAHFIVGKDGEIWQVVPIDRIGHHAGWGNTGHDAKFGIWFDGRDDASSINPPSSYLTSHAMNSWSIGIEMVHVGGSGDYPEAQLAALDRLIDYIDAYYGFQSTIIDHKMWRLYNSDTSPEFAGYLRNYQTIRRHA